MPTGMCLSTVHLVGGFSIAGEPGRTDSGGGPTEAGRLGMTMATVRRTRIQLE